MKRIILLLGLTLFMGLAGIGKAHAQFVVHDPGHTFLNSTEWITNVKKWVTQINEMIDAQELRLGLQKIDRLKELKSLNEQRLQFLSEYRLELPLPEIPQFSACNRQPEP